jgi:hypothetical protein
LTLAATVSEGAVQRSRFWLAADALHLSFVTKMKPGRGTIMQLRSRRLLMQFLVVALLPALSGCGLIFGGTTQVIRATSSPDGAMVTAAAGGQDYRTPASLSLERKNNYTFTFSAPGYNSQKFDVKRSIRGGVVVLDVLCGLVGVVIDAATGAWYRLSPEVVTVALTKTDTKVPGPDVIQLSIALKSGSEATEIRVNSTPSTEVNVHVQAR